MQRQPITTQLRNVHDDYLDLCDLFCAMWREFTSDGEVDTTEIARLARLMEQKAELRSQETQLIEEADDGMRVAISALRIGPNDSTGRTKARIREFGRLHRPLSIPPYQAKERRPDCHPNDAA